MKPEKEEPSPLHRALSALETPSDFFSGLRLNASLCPDNILLFKRLETPDFRPGGVIDNLHHRYELLVVLEKGGAVTIGDARHRLEPGEAALIFPHQFHHYMDVDEGPIQWLFITFELMGNGENRGNGGAELAGLQNSPRKLSPEADARLASIVLEYTKYTQYARKKGTKGTPAPAPNTLRIAHDLAELLRILLAAPRIPTARRNIHVTHQARDSVLEKINAYVRENFAEAPTLQCLAAQLGYSESHLRTIFRDQLGISLGRYIRNSRLVYASQLLQQGRLPIAEIARLSGFDSPFAFSRAFKNTYGTTPRDYSKRFTSTDSSSPSSPL